MKSKISVAIVLFALTLLSSYVWAASVELTSARIAVRQGEWQRAIENLLIEVENNPDVEAYYLLAKSYAELGDFKSASEFFVKADTCLDTEKEVKEFGEIMYNDRRTYWVKAYQASVTPLTDGLEYMDDPEMAPPGVTGESKLKEAIDAFTNADKIFPYHPQTQFIIGTAYDRLSKYASYKEENGVLVEYIGGEETREIPDSDYAELPLVKAYDAYILALEVKMDDMMGDDIAKDYPIDEYVDRIAKTAARLGDFEPALNAIEAGIQKFPDDTGMLYWDAYIYEVKGNLDKAAELYEKVIAKGAGVDYADAYNALGDIYLNDGFSKHDPAKALEYLEAGLEITPDSFQIITSMGKAYNKLGRSAEAEACLTKAQTYYEINKGAVRNTPKSNTVSEFGEPEENFTITRVIADEEIEVEVAKFTYDKIVFYVQFYDDKSIGWSTARPE